MSLSRFISTSVLNHQRVCRLLDVSETSQYVERPRTKRFRGQPDWHAFGQPERDRGEGDDDERQQAREELRPRLPARKRAHFA